MKKIYDNIFAVILVGGLSARMGGGIKSLKKFNNKIIFDRIIENLEKQVKKIIINSNDAEGLFIKYKKEIIKDSFKGFLGPLAGIHTSLKWITTNTKNVEWLITVPGDTPFIPKNLVKRLFDIAKNNNYKIVLAKSNQKIHPIIGIWHTSLYKSLNNDLNLGTRKIIHWASKHSLGYAKFYYSKYDPFFNVNYKEDINKAKNIENKYIKKKHKYFIC